MNFIKVNGDYNREGKKIITAFEEITDIKKID